MTVRSVLIQTGAVCLCACMMLVLSLGYLLGGSDDEYY